MEFMVVHGEKMQSKEPCILPILWGKWHFRMLQMGVL